MRKKRRRYAEAFKKESVEYLISSGKPIIHVARELGLNDATLGTWKRQYAGDPTVKTPALEELTVDELKRELKRLKKEKVSKAATRDLKKSHEHPFAGAPQKTRLYPVREICEALSAVANAAARRQSRSSDRQRRAQSSTSTPSLLRQSS